MIFAIVNGEKTEATPKITGVCPLCEHNVFSKCGEINVWHWAHLKDESCDSWYEPETEWHKNWKLTFGKDKCEIIISKDGIRHIADILTIDNIVIELQNSPIQKPIIRKRENFYGERMLWIINGKHFKNNFLISPIKDKVTTNIDKLDINALDIFPNKKNDFTFFWSWCRKSWREVERNVFIDFGDENLFWVKSGMGTRFGLGRKVKKEGFLTKYGGDLSLLGTLIDK